MPLKEGKKNIGSNIGELISTYKEKGKIGNTTPKSLKHAKEIAAAIAYEKAGESKPAKKKKKKKKVAVESLENFILSLRDGKNSYLIENIILEGFHTCFESVMFEDETQVNASTDDTTTTGAPSTEASTLDPKNMNSEQLASVAVLAKDSSDKAKAVEAAKQNKEKSDLQLQKVTQAASVTPTSGT